MRTKTCGLSHARQLCSCNNFIALLISNRRSGRQRVFGNHQLESLHLVDAGKSKSLQLWGSSIAREVVGNTFTTENR
jgi:hypothetical protein